METKLSKEARNAMAVVSILVLPIGIVLDALAFRVLWTWFAVPLGAPLIGLGAAAGASFFIGYATKHYDPAKIGMNDDQQLGVIAYSLLNPIVAMLFGWLIHSVIA
jgi:hypothetical protein